MPDISVYRINFDSEGMQELGWRSVVNGLHATWLGFWFIARARNFFLQNVLTGFWAHQVFYSVGMWG